MKANAAMVNLSDLSAFQTGAIRLTNDYFVNAVKKEIQYLLSLDPNKLLAGFRETAGIDTKGATRYSGWEDSLIGGHTLGHYLTACAQAYQSANTADAQKKQLLSVITEIIDVLKECQEKIGTGFLFGARLIDRSNIEAQFDHVEQNRADIFHEAWVPWYTMHKLIAGLVSVAGLEDESAKAVTARALRVASGLGDWTYKRTTRWSEDVRNTVLGIEYGGMNDCLYDLYRFTGKSEHAKAAHLFDEEALFERVLKAKSGDNVLSGIHANTTIPKFTGALKRYVVYRDDPAVDADIYLDYARAFWDLVVNDHTYITGDNSEWEHFGPDGVLDSRRSHGNCETCNAYNMLKLTKLLYMITGNIKYADYYENTFLNSIMSSQNPETGMTTYFQPMGTGYFKVYSTPYTKFWCCTGSGMENFSKLGESLYYHKDNILVVNQYISSVLCWPEQGVTVTQETTIPDTDTSVLTISVPEGGKADITIALRLPDWLAFDASVSIDGTGYHYAARDGYAFVSGPFADGTKITVTLPMKTKACSLPDNDSVYAFKYGPVVLSALLGTKDMTVTNTGIDVTIPEKRIIEAEYVKTETDTIRVPAESVKEFIDHINDYMVRDTAVDELTFRLKNKDTDLTFVTHYSQYQQRYGIYWRIEAGH